MFWKMPRRIYFIKDEITLPSHKTMKDMLNFLIFFMLQKIWTWSQCFCTILTFQGFSSNREWSALHFWKPNHKVWVTRQLFLWIVFWSFWAPLWSLNWPKTRWNWRLSYYWILHLAVTLNLRPLWLIYFPSTEWSFCSLTLRLWSNLLISKSFKFQKAVHRENFPKISWNNIRWWWYNKEGMLEDEI
jgi:hypothetical protein